MARYLARRGLLHAADDQDGDRRNGAVDDGDNDTEPTLAQGHAALWASAVSGQSPPAGPELRRKGTPLAPLGGKPMLFDKPLCASLDGFTLHVTRKANRVASRHGGDGSRLIRIS